jgi:hypothetical protein
MLRCAKPVNLAGVDVAAVTAKYHEILAGTCRWPEYGMYYYDYLASVREQTAGEGR